MFYDAKATVTEGSSGNLETSQNSGNEGQGNSENGKRISSKEILTDVGLFFNVVLLVLVAEMLWVVTDYVLKNPGKVIEFSAGEIWNKGLEYLTNPLHGIRGIASDVVLHSLLLVALLLSLYFICSLMNCFFVQEEYRRNKIAIMLILLFLLVIDLSSYYFWKTKFTANMKSIYISYLIVTSSFLYQCGKLSNLGQLRIGATGYLRRQRKIVGAALYIIFLHLFVCFLFTELKESTGIFILFGVALLVPIGFFVSFVIFNDITTVNSKILNLLGISVRDWTDVADDLKKNAQSLLNHFLVAIFSYVFLRAFLEVIHLDESTSIMTSILTYLKENLFIILLLPLYVFFYRVSSRILRSIYRRIYGYLFSPERSTIPEERGKIIVEALTKLTKIIIAILILLSLIGRFKMVDLTLISDSPLQYVIGTLILAPILIWLIVLFLDPFFEEETIEVGSIRAKIKQADLFFTQMETMVGEKVYVPNAELLTRTIKRLTARNTDQNGESSSQRRNEKGIIVHFSCTLSYKYIPREIEEIFKELFRRISTSENEQGEKEKLKEYLQEVGCGNIEEELEYIRRHPSAFVYIEEFKDHGIIYRFNFRMKDSLYAPIYRGYFMRRFKELMEEKGNPIVTPSKIEIKDIGDWKDFRW